MNDAKAFLREIRYEQSELIRLHLQLEYLRKSLIPGGIRYDKIQVQTSPTDMTSEVLAQIGDLELAIKEDTVTLLKNQIKALSPLSVLSRGYGALYSESGSVISNACEVKNGDTVKMRLSDGEITARAEEVRIFKTERS